MHHAGALAIGGIFTKPLARRTRGAMGFSWAIRDLFVRAEPKKASRQSRWNRTSLFTRVASDYYRCELVPYVFHISIGLSTGGERGIRTPDTRKGIHAFEARAFSHSAISPRR